MALIISDKSLYSGVSFSISWHDTCHQKLQIFKLDFFPFFTSDCQGKASFWVQENKSVFHNHEHNGKMSLYVYSLPVCDDRIMNMHGFVSGIRVFLENCVSA